MRKRSQSKEQQKVNRLLMRDLPYYGYDIINSHEQFNNLLSSNLPTKKYLDKLRSFHDIDLFSLNTHPDDHEDQLNTCIRCKYYTPHSFCEFAKTLDRNQTKRRFSIFHNNIRSIRRNIDNLQTHLLDELDFQFSVIGLTETKISYANSDQNIPQLKGYNFEYVPTPLASGGVGMYINDTLNYMVLEKTSNEAYQALWIEIILDKQKNIVCGILYRQHNSPESFQSYFDEAVEKYIFYDKPVYIVGDFNIDLLKSQSSNISQNFLLTAQSLHLIPTIDKPTRVHNTSATLIDNIFTNDLEQFLVSGNIISDLTDHFSQFCISRNPTNRVLSLPHKVRDYSKFSPDDFNNELTQINWDIIITNTHQDIDKIFSTFYNRFNKLVNKHAPLKKLSGRKAKQFSKPWITKGIRRSIKVKNKLFLSGDNEKYKLYRNQILTLTRLSKKQYYYKYFESNLLSVKKTWECINTLLNKKRNRKFICKLKEPDNSGFTQDPSRIANILNSHFASIGRKLASKLPRSLHHFTDYYRQTSHLNSFFFVPVTPYEVQLEILSISNNKAHGLYSSPTSILKCASSTLSYVLANIFNASINCGNYPSKLKHAKVIPIYKDGDETDPNNYRPISLLSNFNRIFERLMCVRLKSYLSKTDILVPSQYGFREQHSTQHATLDIINTIQNNMDKKLYTCGIFIDLKKAFDTVNHEILLQKLYHYGIRGIVNDWFSSYLKSRSQTTNIGPHISEKAPTECGVPQGSVLGPLLFLLYINDITNCSDKFNFYLFADDTSILCSNRNLKSLELEVNTELNKLCEWLTANKLTLNTKKSNYVIFLNYKKKLPYQPTINIYDNDKVSYSTLECKDHVKYLGILIDKNLNWKVHIDLIALKISKAIGIIAKLRHFVPFSILVKLYQSLISPYLMYGISSWGQASQSNLEKLLLLQKRALRLMNFSTKSEHAIPYFIKLNILPVHFLYVESVSCLMYDIQNKLAPVHIQNLFKHVSDIHSYNTRSATADKFYIMSSRLDQLKNSFSRFGARLWNSLPDNIRKSDNRKLFKKQIHEILINILKKENAYLTPSSILEIMKSF